MALQSSYVRDIEKMKVSAYIAFAVQKQSNITWSGNSNIVQFSKNLELHFRKFCFYLCIQHESKRFALHK